MVAVSKPDSSAMVASSKVWAKGSFAPGSRKAGMLTENFMLSTELGGLDEERLEHEVELEDVPEGQDAEPAQVGAHEALQPVIGIRRNHVSGEHGRGGDALVD